MAMHEVVRPIPAGRRLLVAGIVAALVVLGVAAAALTGVVVADAMVRDQVVGLATRLSDYVVGPPMTRSMSGDPTSRIVLDSIVQDRRADPMGRFTVWDDTGDAVFVSEPGTAGARVPTRVDLSAVARGVPRVERSPDGLLSELALGLRAVDVYVPMPASQGRLVFEMHVAGEEYQRQVLALAVPLVGLAILPMVLLAVILVPAGLVVLRRVQGDHLERSRLLSYALVTSDRERGEIATGLHDTVLQNLAGAGYVMSALEPKVPPEDRAGAHTMRVVVQESVESLRGLLIDLHPSSLTATALPRALEGLLAPVRAAGYTVTASVRIPGGVHDAIAVALYRVTRERLAQLLEHARAISVTIEPAEPGVRLRITDEGPARTRRAEGDGAGELGLVLLRERVIGLGGDLVTSTRPDGSTELTVTFVDGVVEEPPPGTPW